MTNSGADDNVSIVASHFIPRRNQVFPASGAAPDPEIPMHPAPAFTVDSSPPRHSQASWWSAMASSPTQEMPAVVIESSRQSQVSAGETATSNISTRLAPAFVIGSPRSSPTQRLAPLHDGSPPPTYRDSANFGSGATGLHECPICRHSDSDLSSVPCGHVFCTSCITEALRVDSRCPMCRQQADATDLRRVYLSG